MVSQWGMSERLGPLSFGRREEQVFLGKELVMHKDYSEKTAEEIDLEVRRIVEECYERAKAILKENASKVQKLVEVLLERESLSGEELNQILEG